MSKPRAADDFPAIRARMKELRGEALPAEDVEGAVESVYFDLAPGDPFGELAGLKCSVCRQWGTECSGDCLRE